jgi:uncharacterized protein (TIGR03067 family)
MSLRLLVVGLVGLLGTARADEKELAAAAKKLEGTWAPTENVLNGEKTPEAVLKPLRDIVKSGTYEGTVDGKRETAGTWKFVAVKGKVLHIDLTATDGPNKGKSVRGIAEFVGDDEWRLCMPTEPGGERPTEFASKKGGGLVLRTYKRVKE